MPKPDAERLAEWEQWAAQRPIWAEDDTEIGEILDLARRWFKERNESAKELLYCHDMQIKADDLAAKLLLEIGRLTAGIQALVLLYEPGQGGPVDRETLLSDLRALLPPSPGPGEICAECGCMTWRTDYDGTRHCNYCEPEGSPEDAK